MVGTLFGLVIKYSVGLSGINAITSLIRTFRVARIFRLVKHPILKKVNLLLSTIGLSLPSILNLMGVLLLFLVIFSILGVQLFAMVGHNDAVNDHAHFQSFGIAFLTLFRSTTGENWNGIMHALASNASDDCTFNVTWDPEVCGYCDWEQIWTPNGDPLKCVECKPINGCGLPLTSQAFFLTFTLVVTYMVLNIFIAVILEAYEQSSLDETAVVTAEDLVEFGAQWQILDGDGNMSIPLIQLPTLMDQLPYPMGFKERETKVKRTEFPEEVYLPTNRCVMFPAKLDDEQSSDDDEGAEEKTETGAAFQNLRRHQKQKEIDEMNIHSYHKDGVAEVFYRDVLFAVTQRAYKLDDPTTAFKIDSAHQEVLLDETKAMKAVPIKTSHYLSALRIAQAYRAHKFRNHFIGMQMHTTAEEKRNSSPRAREAFAAEDQGEDVVAPDDSGQEENTE